MKRPQRVIFSAFLCVAPLLVAGSAMSQETTARQTRKEWLDQVERARQHVEQLRLEGTLIEEKGAPPFGGGAPAGMTRQEWLAQIAAASERVEQIRREGEFLEQPEPPVRERGPSVDVATSDRTGAVSEGKNPGKTDIAPEIVREGRSRQPKSTVENVGTKDRSNGATADGGNRRIGARKGQAAPMGQRSLESASRGGLPIQGGASFAPAAPGARNGSSLLPCLVSLSCLMDVLLVR